VAPDGEVRAIARVAQVTSHRVPRRDLGRDGPAISSIGFGCGGFWGLPEYPEIEAERVVEACIDAGVTFFDTGPNYSRGHAETRIGRLFAGIEDRVFIATKVGSRLDRWGRQVRDFSPDGIAQSVEESLSRLRRSHVDLLQLHGPPLSVLQDEGVLRRLEDIRGQGMVRRLGVSGDGEIVRYVAASPVFDCIMTTVNLLERGNLAGVALASQAGKAVLVKSPMAHAVFSPSLLRPRRLSDLWYLMRILKNYRWMLRDRASLMFLNEVPGWTAAQLALRFVLSLPGVSCAVIGTTKADHLRECVDASSREELPEAIRQRIEELGSARFSK
jgi:aryl-alcohol dehydrogenase-like predicted oxidoreductase